MAKKRMSAMSAKSAKNTQIAIFSFLLIALCVGGYFGGSALGWWGATAATADPTTMDFVVLDRVSGEEFDDDDHDIYIYKCDISTKTTDEIEDLIFSDYTYDTSKDNGETYTPEEDEIYFAKLNGSDIVEYWFIPVLGVNTLYALNETEDVAINAYSTDELSNTVNQTNYDKWTIQTQTLDGAEGTGEATSKEGYASYYDFEDDDWFYVCLEITFNTTAQLSWCDFDSSYQYNERAAGSVLFYEIKCLLVGFNTFEIDLGSTLGTDFEVIQFAISYGDADSNTDWDSQT